MPKLKTHKGTAKRVRVTKNAKMLVRHAGGNHLLQHKSASRKRRFAGMKEMTGKTAKNLKLNLGAK
jgi:large subunit ribosomal protein L35